MNMWTEIRRLVLTGEKSKRAVCDQYEIHWKTLQKILAHEEPPGYRLRKPRPKPKLGPFLSIIHEILKQDRKAPKKQRHTAKRIFERLRDEYGYEGKLTVVKDAVREWKRSRAEVFMPLSHRPAESQVDFGEARVVLRGELTKVAYFVMSLPYSDAFLCQVFPRECTETFQEGHRRAFQFFGGVPRRISYDNTRIAVAKFLGRRGETPTREFLRLQSHYLFEHHFCLVRRPNEKGHTENLIGYARRNFMVPVPQIDGLEVFNRELRRLCREDLDRKLRGKPTSKAALLEEEQAFLLPLPEQAFEARRVELAQANSLSLVRFDGNDYSVPTAYAYHNVTAVGGIKEVRFVVNDRVVARHQREWEREQVIFDPLHYLALLERKPGAFDFARPLEDWDLPECFWVLRRRMEAAIEKDGTREFIKVLRLLESYRLKELTAAVEKTLQIGAATPDAVRLVLEYQQEQPIRFFRLDGRPHLQGVEIPPPQLTAYSSLMGGGSHS